MLSNKREIGGKYGVGHGEALFPEPHDLQLGGGASDQLQLLPEQTSKAKSLDLKAVGFFNELLYQGSDVTMLPAYLAGGVAFRALRLGAVGNWVASPAVKTLSSLFARQVGASALALGGEVAAFTGAHRIALNLAKGTGGTIPALMDVDTEMAGTAITLASLRSFGFGFGMLGGLLQRSGLAGAATQGMLSTLGSYTGLLTAAQAEHRLLHPEIPQTGNPFFNAAVSLVHFTVANAAAIHFTPSAWRGLENSLEQKTYRLLSEKAEQIRNSFPTSLDGGLAWARIGAETVANPTSSEDAKTQGLNFMWKWRKRRLASDPPPSPTEFLESLPPDIKKSANRVDYIIDYGETPFLKTLSQTKLNDPEAIDLAIQRLDYILKTSEPESAKSTYLHWILGLGLRKILEKRDSNALDQLMTMITRPTPMRDIETMLAQQMAGTRFPEPLMGISNRFKRKTDYYETIETMELSAEAKKTLWLLLIAQKKGPDESPYYINPHDFMNRLGQVNTMFYDKWMFVQSILEKAPTSPLGLLRMKRLHLILRSELVMKSPLDVAQVRGLLGIKLRELENDQYETSGLLPNPLPSTDTEIYLGPLGGFMGEFGPWKIYKELAPEIPELIDHARESTRADLSRRVLKEFLVKYPDEAAFEPENIAEAYRQLYLAFKGKTSEFTRGGQNGEMSHHLSLAIQRREFFLEALTKEKYAERYHQLREKLAAERGKPYTPKSIDHTGYYFGANAAKIIHNQEKPIILITRPDLTSLSPDSAADAYLKMLGTGVHEGTHFFEKEKFPEGKWNEGIHIKEEGATDTRNILWMAQHGDAEKLRQYLKESPISFPIRQLDELESYHRQFWDNSYKLEWEQ